MTKFSAGEMSGSKSGPIPRRACPAYSVTSESASAWPNWRAAPAPGVITFTRTITSRVIRVPWLVG